MTGFEDFRPPFNVEQKECGVWDSLGVTDNLMEAIKAVSVWTGWQNHGLEKEEFRIIDSNNRIL